MSNELKKAAAEFEAHTKTASAMVTPTDPDFDRHMAKVRRKLALDVIAPLRGLSRAYDGEIYTYQRGEIQKDFKVNGTINEALDAAEAAMVLLSDIDI
jgi:hypothetical protein